MSGRVKLGIIGLGRWARVLTRAAKTSDKLEIVSGFTRTPDKREAFTKETGIPCAASQEAFLADPAIKGVILTVPNEMHLPVAEAVAKAGKHVYTEKPIADTLENGLRIEALEKKYGVRVMVGHSARLLEGHAPDEAGDRRGRARPARVHGGELLQRAGAGADPVDVALVSRPRAGRAAVAARRAPVRCAALSRRRDHGGALDRVEAVAGRRGGRRPVDDDAAVRQRARSAMSARRGRRRASTRSACSARRA